MLSEKAAIQIAKKYIPDGEIRERVRYRDLYILQIFVGTPEEFGFDPFYSVNANTGEFRDFSIITDGDVNEISTLFKHKEK